MIMYKVSVVGFFSAIHSLAGDVPEREKVPHPHDYKLEWILDIDQLDERGFSLDISLLEKLRDAVFADIEGKNLNAHEYFAHKPVSLENLCDFIYGHLFKELAQRIRDADMKRISCMEIRVWENEQAWAGIRREGEQIAGGR